jgi:hypothetical protein
MGEKDGVEEFFMICSELNDGYDKRTGGWFAVRRWGTAHVYGVLGGLVTFLFTFPLHLPPSPLSAEGNRWIAIWLLDGSFRRLDLIISDSYLMRKWKQLYYVLEITRFRNKEVGGSRWIKGSGLSVYI